MQVKSACVVCHLFDSSIRHTCNYLPGNPAGSKPLLSRNRLARSSTTTGEERPAEPGVFCPQKGTTFFFRSVSMRRSHSGGHNCPFPGRRHKSSSLLGELFTSSHDENDPLIDTSKRGRGPNACPPVPRCGGDNNGGSCETTVG